MDGRPHPPEYARHTWQGFSTGRFEGDVLVVRTTHLKAGWMRRNGLPLSDRATMTDRFHRHGDLITHVMIIEDPVYLTEPLVKTNGFQLSPNGTMDPYPCEVVVEVDRDDGYVPHFLPGRNPFITEFAEAHALPFEATRGGAETALACHYRAATADLKLGFPEVTLGLLPGAGGTVRLPRVAGWQASLELMIGGKPVEFERALALGLIDRALDGDPRTGAVAWARELLAAGALPRRLRELPLPAAAPELFAAWRSSLPPAPRVDRRSWWPSPVSFWSVRRIP